MGLLRLRYSRLPWMAARCGCQRRALRWLSALRPARSNYETYEQRRATPKVKAENCDVHINVKRREMGRLAMADDGMLRAINRCRSLRDLCRAKVNVRNGSELMSC